MKFFKQHPEKQPIPLPDLGSHSTYGSVDSREIKEQETNSDCRPAFDIIKDKMTHPPVEAWAGRYENKQFDRLNQTFKKNIIHFVYENKEQAIVSAAELKNKFNISAVSATLDNYGIQDMSMIKLIQATAYIEKYGKDVCILRIKATELAKMKISLDLNFIDFHPRPNPTLTSTVIPNFAP